MLGLKCVVLLGVEGWLVAAEGYLRWWGYDFGAHGECGVGVRRSGVMELGHSQGSGLSGGVVLMAVG